MLLISQSGLALATHYCGGHVFDSKFVLDNAPIECGMEKMVAGCENGSAMETHFTKVPCCKNDLQRLDVEDDFQMSVLQSSVNIEFIAAFISSFILPVSSVEEAVEYAYCPPPLLESDIPALHQVYLL